MGVKIFDIVTENTAPGNDDRIEIAKVISTGPLVTETQYMEWSTLQENILTLTSTDKIKSSVANKSNITFGLGGNEFIFFNDGTAGADAFIIANSANAQLGNTHGEFGVSAAGAYVSNATQIELLTPRILTNGAIEFNPAVSGDALAYSSEEFQIGYGDDVDLLSGTYFSLVSFGANGVGLNYQQAAGATSSVNAGATGANISYFDVNSHGGNFTITPDETSMGFSKTNAGNITIVDEEIIVTHSFANFAGMTYAADYSANFTARSLVDKGYVDSSLTGVALTSGNLSQFANTTSAQLASVMTDETGTDALVFANSPTLITPNIGAATGASLEVTAQIFSSSPSAGVGYKTGAGNSVTQATSKSTAVSINAVCGEITTHNAALANATSVSFAVNNTSVAATDAVIANIKSGATSNGYGILIETVTAGSFRIQIRNYSGGSLSEAIVITFAVIKAVKT